MVAELNLVPLEDAAHLDLRDAGNRVLLDVRLHDDSLLDEVELLPDELFPSLIGGKGQQ